MTRIAIALVLICSWIVGNVSAEEPAKFVEKASLKVVGNKDLSFAGGASLRTIELKATGVHQLTVRLMVAKDGKADVAQESIYTFGKSKPGAQWQLCYLIQDGEPFGAKGKLFPSVSLKVPESNRPGKREKRSPALVQSKDHTISIKFNGSLEPSKQKVVYWERHEPKGKNYDGPFKTPEDLTRAAKDGRSVIFLLLEWSPAEKSK